MIEKNIFIINYDSLYEILEEIKDILSFKIIKYKNEQDFLKDNHPNIKNFLIITKATKHLLLNKNFSKKNLLDLKSLPVSINKLIELINIQLLKLRFNYQSQIIINSYELNLNSKFISKNNINLRLTEKEIEVILYLNKYKNNHNVIDLQKKIWGYSSEIETHTVETHIYRLRKKISDKFKDKDFILSDQNGYFIK